MALDRDEILLTNLRDSLAVYQSAILWSMAASSAFFLLSLRLGDPTGFRVSVLYGHLGAPAAWGIALVLFFLLGGYAASAIRHAGAAFKALNPKGEIRTAILSIPSIATTPNPIYRLGSVFYCPLTVLISFAIELRREWSRPNADVTSWSWGGILLLVAMVFAPYISIAEHVWFPFGSRRKESGTEDETG